MWQFLKQWPILATLQHFCAKGECSQYGLQNSCRFCTAESQQRLKLSCGWCCILIVRGDPPPKARSQTDKTDERWEVEEERRSEVICLRSRSRSVTEPRIRRLATSCQQDVHCLKLRAEFLWGWNARSSAALLPAAERSHARERWLYFLQGSLCGAWAQPWCRTESVCTRDILQIVSTNHSICQQRDMMSSLPPSPFSWLAVIYWSAKSLSCCVVL